MSSATAANSLSRPIGSAVPAGDLWEVFLGLLLVVAVILVVAWLMRRFQPGLVGGGASMRVLSTLAVGPREKLLLLDVQGQHLLLGVTTQQISTLHQFDQPLAMPAAGDKPDFGMRLRQAIGAGKPS